MADHVTSITFSGGEPEDDLAVVSPELALVDPELARRLRERALESEAQPEATARRLRLIASPALGEDDPAVEWEGFAGRVPAIALAEDPETEVAVPAPPAVRPEPPIEPTVPPRPENAEPAPVEAPEPPRPPVARAPAARPLSTAVAATALARRVESTAVASVPAVERPRSWPRHRSLAPSVAAPLPTPLPTAAPAPAPPEPAAPA